MIRKNRFFAAALLLILSSTTWAALPAVVDGQEMPSLAPLVERVAPAVVNIRVSQTVAARGSPFGDDAFRRFFGFPDTPGGTREVASAGSGVIVDADNGYIITNHHVVAQADEVQEKLLVGGLVNDLVVVESPPLHHAGTELMATRLLFRSCQGFGGCCSKTPTSSQKVTKSVTSASTDCDSATTICSGSGPAAVVP